jgi:catalase
MAYLVDTAPNQNRHVNYEPSSMNGLKEAPKTAPEHTPYVAGNLVRQPIDRTNNFAQAGERYRMFEDWERNDLINNLVSALKPAKKHIQDKMVELFSQCDEDYGRRVREGLQQGANGNGHSTIQADLQADQEVEAMAHSAQPY